MKHRILHVTTVHEPQDPRILFKEARSLARLGFDVSLATTVSTVSHNSGVTLLPLGALGGSRFRRILRNVRALRYMLGSYDVIHLHDPELLIIGGMLAFFGKHLVYDVHEFYHQRVGKTHWLPRGLRSLAVNAYGMLERWVLPRFAGIVVVNAEMIDDYIRFVGRERVALVENFPMITTDEYGAAREQPRPLNEPYIIQTGGASKRRAFHIIVEAAQQLRSRGVAAPIVTLGAVDLSEYSQRDQRDLLKRAEAYDVRLLGSLPYADCLHWMAHARVGYIPLSINENYARALPLKLFEYFRFGLPIVATNARRTEEVVLRTGSGLIVPAYDPAAHADALELLLSQPLEWAKMAHQSAAAGQEYDFHQEFSRLVALYGLILGQDFENQSR